ncbi:MULTISPECIES: hypothetical protein [Acinetobacter]|uniref:Lipoprotein n=1 Tax=Acinetobacter bereziniae NIPH 3 TaxID=1217651 RepID=N8XHC3_ACIBZ|nr:MULTISPECIES: hypothetical protein [Acinetobacter]ELW82338.1 hypothetical protein ACINWC743_1602 [Acinetobacter sp. WC-743]ENV23741.1 hypothetical protein F963_00468 [Acinetobacter bereziniae NIPH 3]MBI0393308.1 hypothetical protein [Acinetobacter bereziniae]MBJ8423519.1 hypothetical protein [Acinetobacter bereziniae]MBJ8425700.1 hypothetical protein [Acinetobacter bereziniae]
MKVLFLVMIVSGLTACASNQSKIYEPTKECRHYHAMMTAPMDPMAMQRLKQACDDSENQR